MRKHVAWLLVLFALSFAAACAEEARPDAFDGCPEIWVADGVAVEILREGEEINCRAVFTDSGEESTVWEYGPCFYDEAGVLQCPSVTRTRERFNAATGTLDELDWSMNDMCFAELRLTGDGMVLSDDVLDAPLALTKLGETEGAARKDALAYTGLWSDGSASLRVDDHGSCYRFTVTVPVDGDTGHRWSYTCLYDEPDGRMASVSNSPRTVITYEADGGTVEIEEDFVTDATAFILEDSNRLVWKDVSGEVHGVFTRITD